VSCHGPACQTLPRPSALPGSSGAAPTPGQVSCQPQTQAQAAWKPPLAASSLPTSGATPEGAGSGTPPCPDSKGGCKSSQGAGECQTAGWDLFPYPGSTPPELICALSMPREGPWAQLQLKICAGYIRQGFSRAHPYFLVLLGYNKGITTSSEGSALLSAPCSAASHC